MKYPYIGKANLDDSLVLFYSDGCGMCFRSDNWSGGLRVDYNESAFKNITPEYLANTYGEVVSPEHAEFIIELAENAGFELARQSKHLGNFFSFDVKGFCFLDTEIIASQYCKKITIPLPPKAESKKWTPDFYELGELPKHFDCVCSKCGGKCCTGRCDKQESSEWPQIGDEVCWSNGKRKGELKSICDGWAWIKDDGGEFVSLMAKFIKKPKTPEEKLRDDIQSIIFKRHAEMVTSIHVKNSLIAMSNSATEILLDEFEIKRKPR